MKTYKNINYIIHPNSGSYCAYIEVPKTSKYYIRPRFEMIFGMKVDITYDFIDIDCHGGLTFSKRIKDKENWPQGFTKGFWIGWDYLHVGDRTDYASFNDDKQWTELEVEKEVKKVINKYFLISNI